jgi:hypothetical protein
LGFNLSQELVMAQENEHIQTLVAELEHRREENQNHARQALLVR